MKAGLIMPGGCAPDECQFPLVLLGDDINSNDPEEPLQPGMEVMLPCENCGMTANDYMAYMDGELESHVKGIKSLQSFKNVPLFHWSPAKHRKQIRRYGLRPGRKPVTHSSELKWRAPYICFADDPAWAWMLSGKMPGAPDGEWDLWQTWFDLLDDLEILMSYPDDNQSDGNGVHEYRTPRRVPKRYLRFIGSRSKAPDSIW